MTRSKPVVLLILDGWGQRANKSDNAIYAANTPTWDHLIQHYPNTLISASGKDVGLPPAQMGNSEVGHLTMGAGRILYQDLTLISQKIKAGDFFKNEVLLDAFKQANRSQKAIHVMGLLSPGGVHSHEEHIFAFLRMAKENQVNPIYFHAILDGRDTPPQSAQASLEKFDQIAKETGTELGSVSGRYYAMDRDGRWDRVKMAFDAIVHGNSIFQASSGIQALFQAYDRKETDEFVKPTCIVAPNKKPTIIHSGDIMVYLNFRADRARALTYALTLPDFKGFDRGNRPILAEFVSLTEYDKNLKTKVAFKPESLKNVLGEFLQNKHLTQLHIAETEKYAHVTFFFNGGIEIPFRGEERILIPSPKVATYDLKPEMSAYEITAALVESILQKKYDFIVCNYANADMVGHTGNFAATKKAIETLDVCLKKVVDALEGVNGEALITSDHGNAECMIDEETGQAHTAHTTNLVPLIYVGGKPLYFKKEQGTLSDIAATILYLMGFEQPNEMTGHSLLKIYA